MDENITAQILKYAKLVTQRGYVCNQLGNIAIRDNSGSDGRELIYCKHRGISLEEMTSENIVATDSDGNLIHGHIRPSIGHVLNRAIFRLRPDVNTVIHLHVDDCIAFFSVLPDFKFQYVSSDTAIILGKAPVILPPELNVEIEADRIDSFIHETNLFVMPNHGITAFGETCSVAYNRINAFVSETRRIMSAASVADLYKRPVAYLNAKEVDELYSMSGSIFAHEK